MIFFKYRNRFLTFLIANILVIAVGNPIHANDKYLPQSITNIEREKIENIVKDFILKNPEHIIESKKSLRQREEIKKLDKIKENINNYQSELINDPDTPIGGNQKGSINIVEFFDYRCGYCKRVLPVLMKLISTDKNIRLIYKEFPILGPKSIVASKAGLSAWILDKSKYQDFHKALMNSKGMLSESRIMKLASNAGYSVIELKKIMRTSQIDRILEKTFNLAKALDINGTPAFIIGDQVIRGAVDLKTLKSLVSEAKGS